LAFVRFYLMHLFIVFCYPHHYKTFAIATSNTIGGHLGKGKNVQVGIKAVYLTLRLFYFHVTGYGMQYQLGNRIAIISTFCASGKQASVHLTQLSLSLI
jgi:hypothetical protein